MITISVSLETVINHPKFNYEPIKIVTDRPKCVVTLDQLCECIKLDDFVIETRFSAVIVQLSNFDDSYQDKVDIAIDLYVMYQRLPILGNYNGEIAIFIDDVCYNKYEFQSYYRLCKYSSGRKYMLSVLNMIKSDLESKDDFLNIDVLIEIMKFSSNDNCIDHISTIIERVKLREQSGYGQLVCEAVANDNLKSLKLIYDKIICTFATINGDDFNICNLVKRMIIIMAVCTEKYSLIETIFTSNECNLIDISADNILSVKKWSNGKSLVTNVAYLIDLYQKSIVEFSECLIELLIKIAMNEPTLIESFYLLSIYFPLNVETVVMNILADRNSDTRSYIEIIDSVHFDEVLTVKGYMINQIVLKELKFKRYLHKEWRMSQFKE